MGRTAMDWDWTSSTQALKVLAMYMQLQHVTTGTGISADSDVVETALEA
jgi:hypothetical protein